MRLPFLAGVTARPSSPTAQAKGSMVVGTKFSGTARIPGTTPKGTLTAAAIGTGKGPRGKGSMVVGSQFSGSGSIGPTPKGVLVAGSKFSGTGNLTAWPNGYKNQHEIRMQAWRSGAPTVSNYLLLFSETDAAFKSTGSGGPVQSGSGYDIRFETTGGTKLSHRLLYYNGGTGQIAAVVNMTRNLAADESIYLYVGKAGLVSSEEDATGARAGGWLAWYSGAAGTDFTGNGHGLTPTNGPTSAALGGWQAAQCDGINDYLVDGSASTWLNGLSALSMVAHFQAASLASQVEVLSVANGATTELSLALEASSTTTDRIVAQSKFGGSTYSLNSTNGEADTAVHAYGISLVAGSATVMALDGAQDNAVSTTITAATTSSASSALKLGAGGRTGFGYFGGKVGFVAFRSVAMGRAELESMTAALLDPRLVYGIGSANVVSSTNRSPVALRINTTATAGSGKLIDVSSFCYDQNGDSLTLTAASVLSGAGTATVSGSTVTVTPDSGVNQSLVASYTVKDPAGLTSTGRIDIVASIRSADLFYAPFKADSISYLPIGDGATYGADTDVETTEIQGAGFGTLNPGRAVGINGNDFGHPCFKADSTVTSVLVADSLYNGKTSNYFPAQLRIVDAAKYEVSDQTHDTTIHIYYPDTGRWHHINHYAWNRGSPSAWRHVECDVNGYGHAVTSSDNTSYGCSASGASNAHGIVRGVDYAGLTQVPNKRLRIYGWWKDSTKPFLGLGYHLPANRQDGSASAANNFGHIKYGDILAIPRNVNVTTIPGLTAFGKLLARQMQVFGMWVSDSGSNGIPCDQDMTASGNKDLWITEMKKIFPYLRVVTNCRTDAQYIASMSAGCIGGGRPIG